MQPFRQHTGIVAPLDRPNVDTDQIIPKQFLKRIERTGLGQFLFFDWRYALDGAPKAEFFLNQPQYAKATILVAGRNFGCGSSREHAPWALCDHGFRALIAPSFGDIFSNNSAQNGLLLVVLPEKQVAELTARAKQIPGYSLTVDLEKCEVRDSHGFLSTFAMSPFRRRCLLEGLDDIGLTLLHESEITAFEQRRDAR
jgi:3-isopropylmalate/(R)-2-methylmalate dehydratase small subunit